MKNIITDDETVVRVAARDPQQVLSGANTATDSVVTKVGTTGVQAIEPLVMVTHSGRTAFHTQCSPERADEITEQIDETDDETQGTPDAVAEHDPETTRLPIPELPGLDAGVRNVLSGCGWRRPTNPSDHELAGGFLDVDPAAVLEVGRQLRGRGWGDSCHNDVVADAWQTVRSADEETTLVVNAHGTNGDTVLLASAPFEVLDGAAAVVRAADIDRVVVYASTDDERPVETLQTAVDNHPNLEVPLDVVTGPADYRAAEPTMAIESIEGNHRLEARLRPPHLEDVGLHGRPTLVHTPRTLANLSVALRREELPATRVLTLMGDVAAPATIELPESGTISEAVSAVAVEGSFKAACVGGRFGGLTQDLDVAVDPDSLSEAELGTDGTIRVLSADRCIVEFVGRLARFASEENCGRCVPCREGTTQLTELLRDVYDGEYAPGRIEELVRVMETSSICSFGVQAARPARTAIEAFEVEFQAHADGQCPAGSCVEAMEVS
ncbi:NADH-ubiquinone oxidoreductase-F iron-sulfur binding region domain-containing protein [Haloarcula amylovorans]|uniref:NADH-ubiquinone oxidoreductase-F iron-sulfur binding region domain-containing protein n=1 Tax=Haloarcula amylovorans TaxID=2562280 RepID=UPI0010763FEE|nr:NADH-ubiquinone oxidoreductase-F iron-sulfur binding region domain-containing protein [Halomicroarcula amylolytica]